jgi:hypothetical protein
VSSFIAPSRPPLLQRLRHLFAQPRHAERQLVAAPRRLAEPERNVGRGALRVFDPHAARLDLQDAVAGVAQLEHVARQALDREVFVHRADLVGLRLQHHGVVAGLGDGAAGGERRHAGALALAQQVVHRVAVHVAGTLALARGEALGHHAHHFHEAGMRQARIGPGAAHQREELVLVPFAAGRLGHDLLGQHVERRGQHAQRVELAAADAVEQRGAFDQFVARLREQPRLRHPAHRVARAAGPLQKGGDGAGRADLADQVDVADVQPQLQRGGGHQHLQLAALQALLGIEPRLFRQAAVVRRHRLLAQDVAQVPRRALGHAARVDEHQRGLVQPHQLGHARVHLRPLLARHHGFQRRGRQLERQVALLGVADVDDGAVGRAVRVQRAGADQEARHLVDGLLRGREADAYRPRPCAALCLGVRQAQRLQPLQRQRQVAAALARGNGVDLVDDHAAHRREHLAARGRAQQHIERLRRGHQNVRRPAQALLALALRRVAGAHGGADVDVGQAQCRQLGADARERRVEVQADVVRQRLQRRHVDHRGFVLQPAGRQAPPHQVVQRREEGRERLARAGGRGHQRVAPGPDRRPCRGLRGGGAGEGSKEPLGDGGVKEMQGH